MVAAHDDNVWSAIPQKTDDIDRGSHVVIGFCFPFPLQPTNQVYPDLN
jgi:hypothetical protein